MARLSILTATDEAFAGGWFHSGDLGQMHPDGYIQLKDRSKDITTSGGENISSIELEDVLYKHRAVQAASVVAKPGDKWGETPCAFIELKPGHAPTPEEIVAYCREHVAHYKAPRFVVFGELPKTSTGKVQKYILREKAKALSCPEPHPGLFLGMPQVGGGSCRFRWHPRSPGTRLSLFHKLVRIAALGRRGHLPVIATASTNRPRGKALLRRGLHSQNERRFGRPMSQWRTRNQP